MSQAGERVPVASLGLLDATMVGAGIFVLTGLAAVSVAPTRCSNRASATWSRWRPT